MVNKLPNRKAAVVEEVKMRDYLLNLDHPKGWGKAKFFIAQGFHKDYLGQFRSMLLNHAEDNPVIKVETTKYITKYIIEGPAKFAREKVLSSYTEGPNKRKVEEVGFEIIEIKIVTVWGIGYNSNVPKLVTAYPM